MKQTYINTLVIGLKVCVVVTAVLTGIIYTLSVLFGNFKNLTVLQIHITLN